jgi:type II secretory pathway pseudopilin PulG
MQNENGTTVLEMLLALGLISMVMAGLMSSFWFTLFTFNREITQSDIQYAVRQGRERIIRDFRCSEGFYIQNAALDDMPMGREGQRLHLIKTAEKIDYYSKNNQLYRDSSLSSPEPVAENISDIKFISTVPGLVRITIASRIGGNSFALKTNYMRRIDYPN